MEVNKEEALRCLHIAQKHRNGANLTSALKFAKKSVSLYSTPEGNAMVTIVEREISTSTTTQSTSTSAEASGTSTPQAKAKSSGVEEHITSAHQRKTASASAEASGSGSKKREFTPKQMEVVKRVKSCQHHEYYKILAVEKSCTENDVKKAYKKLALALHPDKNGAPGADEAFKSKSRLCQLLEEEYLSVKKQIIILGTTADGSVVSKAFQILSDGNMRAAFDSNPTYDPTQRNPGMSSSGMRSNFNRGGGGGGMYADELNPEDLFNMFFGGGGGRGGQFGNANVFTFGGPGGFRTTYGGAAPRRPRTAEGADANPIVALLPIIILFAFALISLLPSILSGSMEPDPGYTFEPMGKYSMDRSTWQRGVKYYVDKPEWEESSIWKSIPDEKKDKKDMAMYSQKIRVFETGIENDYINRLRQECNIFEMRKRQQIQDETGFFGLGTDYDKIQAIRKKTSPSCDQLRKWGLSYSQQQQQPRLF